MTGRCSSPYRHKIKMDDVVVMAPHPPVAHKTYRKILIWVWPSRTQQDFFILPPAHSCAGGNTIYSNSLLFSNQSFGHGPLGWVSVAQGLPQSPLQMHGTFRGFPLTADSRAILRVRTSKIFQRLDVTVQKPVGRMDPPHKGVGPQNPVTHEKVALSREDVALGQDVVVKEWQAHICIWNAAWGENVRTTDLKD